MSVTTAKGDGLMKKLDITIVGGGSTYTPALLKTICDYQDQLPIRSLTLYDIDEERQAKVGRFAEILFKEKYPEVEEIHYTTDEEKAFANKDFVLMQIRSGGLKMRVDDEQIPLKHGAVGQETCGPGGFAYGMRTLQQFIDIVKGIRHFSPDAWIINYSNPAAIVAEATKREFPDDKRLINICDMPIAIMDAFSSVLDKDRSQLSPRYFGLNHFGWFTALYDETGKDRLPEIHSFLKDKEILPSEEAMLDESWQDTFKQLAQMTRDFDGYIPNTYLQYYLYPAQMVEKSNPTYTRANEVINGREKNVFSMLDDVNERQTVEGSSLVSGVHGDYIIDLMASIINNESEMFLVMVENKGAIENLPSDAMVEVPCLVNANGVEPLRVGPIPTFYKGLLENQLAYEKLTVDAYYNNSYDDALKALVLNRTVVDTPKAKAILNDLIEANKDHWPKLD
ncbi:6-phospho-alpha-glucosidase [Rossellomorea oryzaecorticis]